MKFLLDNNKQLTVLDKINFLCILTYEKNKKYAKNKTFKKKNLVFTLFTVLIYIKFVI
jgi:hypothetical protein